MNGKPRWHVHHRSRAGFELECQRAGDIGGKLLQPPDAKLVIAEHNVMGDFAYADFGMIGVKGFLASLDFLDEGGTLGVGGRAWRTMELAGFHVESVTDLNYIIGTGFSDIAPDPAHMLEIEAGMHVQVPDADDAADGEVFGDGEVIGPDADARLGFLYTVNVGGVVLLGGFAVFVGYDPKVFVNAFPWDAGGR